MPTLTVTDEQLRVIHDALDLYVRVGLGQLWEVESYCHHLGEGEPSRAHEIALRYQLVRLAADLQQLPLHASMGVGNPGLPERVNTAYDLECVLRPQEWPLHLGPEPLAVLKAGDDDEH